MLFRLFLTNKLKVGFAHVGDIRRFDQMNLIEKIYFPVIGITVGFFIFPLISFTLYRPFLNNEFGVVYIIFSILSVISILSDDALHNPK
jgi:hypothetical protein